MIAIIDYGMGNLRSVEKALAKLGHEAVVTADPDVIRTAERVILPGVGAFGAAMENLRRPDAEGRCLAEAAVEAIQAGKPFLGICLGMQLLFEESNEHGSNEGLGVIPGRVERFELPAGSPLKVPHMGWNAIRFAPEARLFQGLEDGVQVYFVHSYACRPEDAAMTVATCEHGGPFCAAISSGNVHTTQFHPEKSGSAGLRILQNFALSSGTTPSQAEPNEPGRRA